MVIQNNDDFMNPEILGLTEKAKHISNNLELLNTELRKVIVGQQQVINRLMIALCADGHVLLEGVPGIAKTLTIRTLSQCIDCSFTRLQFTPDMLPSDIMGTKVYNQRDSSFSTSKGPIFASFVLADEINRAPPKVQSALLEAMQERQVTIQGDTLQLPHPFFVLATENPIESEGTYSLPEAQVDRFMFKVIMTYPKKDEEITILDRFTEGYIPDPKHVITAEKILEIQEFTKKVYADITIKNYVTSIVDSTRYPEQYGIDLARHIAFGASPRASICFILGAKANAMMHGRGYVVPEDVKAVAHDVLRHRLMLTYEAEADEVKPEAIIDTLLKTVRVP